MSDKMTHALSTTSGEPPEPSDEDVAREMVRQMESKLGACKVGIDCAKCVEDALQAIRDVGRARARARLRASSTKGNEG